MSTRAPAAATQTPPHTLRLARALPRLTPRLTLVATGTLLQAVAFLGWMALPPQASGLQLAAWPLVFMCAVACLVAVVATPPGRLERWPRHARPLALVWSALLASALAFCVVGALWASADLVLTQGQDPAAYVSDAAAFNHFDAELVLAGRNPYVADDAFWTALRQFPAAAATPLRRGRFADEIWPPSTATLRAAVRAETTDPAQRDGSFAPASLHSYPALSFLLAVPAVWAGLGSTLPVSLLGLCGLLLAIGLRLPPGHRLLGWGLLLANVPALLLTLRGSFEVFALLPLVLAWHWLPRRWLSALLVGLGCAIKQVVWPLALLYLVVCARRYGVRETARRAGIALGAFLAPNLPFLVLTPGAWARSLLLPMTLPLFPDGIGLVALARTGLLPLLPAPAYALLELAALAGVALWLWRSRSTLAPLAALPLGLLPLALAWRSLLAYFVWLPALSLVVLVPLLASAETAVAGGEPGVAPVPGDPARE